MSLPEESTTVSVGQVIPPMPNRASFSAIELFLQRAKWVVLNWSIEEFSTSIIALSTSGEVVEFDFDSEKLLIAFRKHGTESVQFI